MLVHVFHRVFNGDDVAVGIFIAMTSIAASVVDFPEPVPPTSKTSRVWSSHVFQYRWQAHFIKIGNLGGDRTQHHAYTLLLLKYVDAETPDPGGLMAKLHSWVASNSAACLSFMMLRANSCVCCELST